MGYQSSAHYSPLGYPTASTPTARLQPAWQVWGSWSPQVVGASAQEEETARGRCLKSTVSLPCLAACPGGEVNVHGGLPGSVCSSLFAGAQLGKNLNVRQVHSVWPVRAPTR